MENPYESPAASGDLAKTREFNLLRFALFLVNFSVAAVLLFACIFAIAKPGSPFAFIGAVVGLPPLVVYTLSELVAYYRRNHSIERKLGYANLGCAIFVAFGVITDVGEALLTESQQVDVRFLSWFILIGLVIIAYLIFAGYMRLRR